MTVIREWFLYHRPFFFFFFLYTLLPLLYMISFNPNVTQQQCFPPSLSRFFFFLSFSRVTLAPFQRQFQWKFSPTSSFFLCPTQQRQMDCSLSLFSFLKLYRHGVSSPHPRVDIIVLRSFRSRVLRPGFIMYHRDGCCTVG